MPTTHFLKHVFREFRGPCFCLWLSVRQDSRAVVTVLTLVLAGFATQGAAAGENDDELPLVTIVATDPDASKIGAHTGTFTLRRDGDLADELQVFFEIGGSAINNQDYEQIEDAVVIAADADFATVLITPIPDGAGGPDTEVALTLLEDPAYRVDEPSSATVHIQADVAPPFCFPPLPTTCKNQWLIDAYIATCEFVIDACNWTIDAATGLCHDACHFTEDAYEALCNTAKAGCDAGNNVCEAVVDLAREACLITGLGSGCNARDVGCRADCAGQCTSQCAGSCVIPWRDSCSSCVSNCSTSCNNACTNAWNRCKEANCPREAECLNCDVCEETLQLECDLCEAIAEAECKDRCEDTAPPCIEEKQLGEVCNWSQCAPGLVCQPDMTSLEGLSPGSLIELLLMATNIQGSLEDIQSSSTARVFVDEDGNPDFDIGQFFCVNNNCTCSLPLLEMPSDELDALACMALYRPWLHLQAWLVNDAIGGVDDFRDELADKWEAAGMPAALADEVRNHYRRVAFAYGFGAGAAALAGVSAELGSVYGPRCFGCYYTLCMTAQPDVNINLANTITVFDATGEASPAIKNLAGWNRVIQLGGSFPGVEVGAAAIIAFAAPPGLTFEPSKVFKRSEWEEQFNEFKALFEEWKDIAEDAAGGNVGRLFDEMLRLVLEQFIPTGRGANVSLGLGINPVNVSGGLCHTWVKESICLRDSTDSGGKQCLEGLVRIDEREPDPDDPGIQPPIARCQDRTVVASAYPGCTADVSIDWGSWNPIGGVPEISQEPPGPFGVGVTEVVMTASNEVGSSTCTATVTVLDGPPLIAGISESHQTLQYSDAISPVTITANDCGEGPLTISHVGLPEGLSLPAAAEDCFPTANGVECSFELSGAALAPEGDYDVELSIVDAREQTSAASHITFRLDAEDATVVLDGSNPRAVQTAVEGGHGEFSLTAHVQELLPDQALPGAALPGDIRHAELSIELIPVGPGPSVAATCVPDNADGLSGFDYDEVLTATCDFDGVPVNVYTVNAVLSPNEEGELFYVGGHTDQVIVFDSSLGFTTGGGHFFWPGTLERTNFTYILRYHPKRNDIRGNFQLIRHTQNGDFRLKSNDLFGIAIGEGGLAALEAGFGWAAFSGEAVLQDPSMAQPEGGYRFVAYVEDHGDTDADGDRFWIRVFDRNDDVVMELSMTEPATKTSRLISGNIAVPHTPGGRSAAQGAAGHVHGRGN